MAGRNHTCADCGCKAFMRRKGPCVACGSENNPADGNKVLEPIPCIHCGEIFQPKHHLRKTCSTTCINARENDERKAKRLAAREAKAAAKAAQKAAQADAQPSRPAIAGLGPAEPPKCEHVCAGYPGYTCKVRTPDRRCPKCRAKWKFMNNAEGGYMPQDYFAGGVSIMDSMF